MTQLQPIQIDENTIIYIEATESINVPSEAPVIEEGEEELQPKSISKTVNNLRQRFNSQTENTQENIVKSFNAVETTIKSYTNYALNAFKQGVNANVDKVTLEFGITIGGEIGVPYVTKGTAESSLKITVECSFPDSNKS